MLALSQETLHCLHHSNKHNRKVRCFSLLVATKRSSLLQENKAPKLNVNKNFVKNNWIAEKKIAKSEISQNILFIIYIKNHKFCFELFKHQKCKVFILKLFASRFCRFRFTFKGKQIAASRHSVCFLGRRYRSRWYVGWKEECSPRWANGSCDLRYVDNHQNERSIVFFFWKR